MQVPCSQILTLPFSKKLVSMTITWTLSSQVMRQKSPTVLNKGPEYIMNKHSTQQESMTRRYFHFVPFICHERHLGLRCTLFLHQTNPAEREEKYSTVSLYFKQYNHFSNCPQMIQPIHPKGHFQYNFRDDPNITTQEQSHKCDSPERS